MGGPLGGSMGGAFGGSMGGPLGGSTAGAVLNLLGRLGSLRRRSRDGDREPERERRRSERERERDFERERERYLQWAHATEGRKMHSTEFQPAPNGDDFLVAVTSRMTEPKAMAPAHDNKKRGLQMTNGLRWFLPLTNVLYKCTKTPKTVTQHIEAVRLSN